MKRYINFGDGTFREDPAGGWVLLDEALAESEQARKEGYSDGLKADVNRTSLVLAEARKEGEAKGYAIGRQEGLNCLDPLIKKASAEARKQGAAEERERITKELMEEAGRMEGFASWSDAVTLRRVAERINATPSLPYLKTEVMDAYELSLLSQAEG